MPTSVFDAYETDLGTMMGPLDMQVSPTGTAVSPGTLHPALQRERVTPMLRAGAVEGLQCLVGTGVLETL